MRSVPLFRRLLSLLALSLPLIASDISTAQQFIGLIPKPVDELPTFGGFGRWADLSSDFNGDGTRDLALMYRSTSGVYKVLTYDLKRTSLTQSALIQSTSLITQYVGAEVQFAAGDITGDGQPDFVISQGLYSNANTFEYGCVSVQDGRTGRQIFTMEGEDANTGCGSRIQVIDLDRDGRSEIVVLEPVTSTGSRIFILKYQPSSGTMAMACQVRPNEQSYDRTKDLIAGPDFNADGVRDLYLGNPEAFDMSGTVLVASGRTCELLALDRNFPANAQVGGRMFSSGDLDGDGNPEVHAEGAGYVYTYSGASGNRLRGIATPQRRALTATGDLNGDRVPDFISESNTQQEELAILSGATGKPLGLLQRGELETIAEKTLGHNPLPPSRMSFQTVESADPVTDLDGDGFSEFLIQADGLRYTRFGEQNVAVVIVSGACPRQIALNPLPRPDSNVEVGEGVFQLSAKACGLNLPAAFAAVHQGQTIQLNDTGNNGDAGAGDGIHSALLSFVPGPQTIGVVGAVSNEAEIRVSGTMSVNGVANYTAVPINYSWIEPSNATRINGIGGTSDFVEIAAPFPIRFYGSTYQDLVISKFGFIGIGESIAKAPERNRLPSETNPYRMVAPFWGNIEPGTGGQITYKTTGSPGKRYLIVTWEGYVYRSFFQGPAGQSSLSFQVVFMEETGGIVMSYARAWSGLTSRMSGGEATAGLQLNERLGVTYSHNLPRLIEGTSVAYVYGAQPGGGGTTPPGGGTGGGAGGGNTGGGVTTPRQNPPAPQVPPVRVNPVVRFIVSHSVKSGTASASVIIRDATTGASLDLSTARCQLEISAGEGTSVASSYFYTVGSVRGGARSRTVTINRMPSMSRVTNKKRKPIYGYLKALLSCPDGTRRESNTVKISAPRTSRGKKTRPINWTIRIGNALVG